MNRTSVRSSNLVSVGYDESQQILEIEFERNLIYEYYDVPIEAYKGLMDASSHGKYFSENIKDVYRYRKIG